MPDSYDYERELARRDRRNALLCLLGALPFIAVMVGALAWIC